MDISGTDRAGGRCGRVSVSGRTTFKIAAHPAISARRSLTLHPLRTLLLVIVLVLLVPYMLTPFYAGVFTKDVKYDSEHTGLGWKTFMTATAQDLTLPTICKMKRPE